MSDTAHAADFTEGFTGERPAAAAPAPAPEASFAPIVERISQKYPALAPHIAQAKIQWGDPQQFERNGGHIEFFPPWELHNPNPGEVTLEIYNRGLTGQRLEDAIAGDMLHYLSSVSPEGKAVDPQWRQLRDQVIAARDPEAIEIDRRAYARAQQQGDTRSFEEWMDISRADAYVRGYITPDERNEWAGAYNPEQQRVLDAMLGHLKRLPAAGGGLIDRAR